MLACEAKAEADLALGHSDRVVAELPQWLAAHPFRERMRGMLMLALYRLGCRADALAVYRDGYQLMVVELGLEPGPPLRALHHHVLADDWAKFVETQVPFLEYAAFANQIAYSSRNFNWPSTNNPLWVQTSNGSLDIVLAQERGELSPK